MMLPRSSNSERTLLLGFLVVIASLAFIAKAKSCYSEEILAEPPPPLHELCEVVIEGAVLRPGTFKVPPGTLLKKVLKKSGPLPAANLKEMDVGQRVEGPLHLHIDEIKELTIKIEKEGEEPFLLLVPVGSKVSYLKTLGLCQPSQAKQIFKSRRKIKDGETFCIPKSGIISEEITSIP